jgi:hypothetical protein
MCISSLVLHLLFCLAADRVDIKGLLPNPGGDAQSLVADGRYWVAPGNKLVGIKLIAGHPDSGQLSWRSAVIARSEWNGKLALPAGNYDCLVEMVTKNAAGKLRATRTTIGRVTVE